MLRAISILSANPSTCGPRPPGGRARERGALDDDELGGHGIAGGRALQDGGAGVSGARSEGRRTVQRNNRDNGTYLENGKGHRVDSAT
jgi:hypothetical protein